MGRIFTVLIEIPTYPRFLVLAISSLKSAGTEKKERRVQNIFGRIFFPTADDESWKVLEKNPTKYFFYIFFHLYFTFLANKKERKEIQRSFLASGVQDQKVSILHVLYMHGIFFS